ncbi:MAG: AAA family ATPase [Candidatus Hydrothermales bacterium]
MNNSQFAIVMRGAPRAGKTVISKKIFENLKEKGVILVQYDEIFKIKKNFEKNRIRFSIFYEIVKKLLKEGYSLILDYSFTHRNELMKILKYIKKKKIRYRIYLLNPPFETLLERDKKSIEPKGEEKLLKFYNRLLKNINPCSITIDTAKLSEEESLELILKDLKENDII